MNIALEDRLLTAREAAPILRVAEETVRIWARKGLIGKKLGGSWRFRRDELEEFTSRKQKEVACSR